MLLPTTFDLDEYMWDAIVAGASAFLLTDVRPRDLGHAVRTIAAGESLVAPAVTRRLLTDFVRRPPPGRRADRLAPLTGRELDLRDRAQAVVAAYETGLVVPSGAEQPFG